MMLARKHLIQQRHRALRCCRAYSSAAEKPILVEHYPAPHAGSIRVLLLNRPNNRNALSRNLCNELARHVEELKTQKSEHGIRALVIASNIDKAFCAGADLKERKDMSVDEAKEFLTGVRQSFTDLSRLPIPTISAVSSMALGGGLEFALSTTLRVFASTAIVGLPETRLAILPGAGGTYRLPAAIGLQRARDMILTGRRVSAAEAYFLGLCDRLVEVTPEEEKVPGAARTKALDVAVSLAREICEGGPIGVTQALKAVNGWERGEESMKEAYEVVLQTEDRMEALRAFAEKRKPAFKGR